MVQSLGWEDPLWNAFASRAETGCENPGLAGPHPHTGVDRMPSHTDSSLLREG